jgi:predicted dehydrogenase
MNQQVNWGIIGLGRIAHKFAADLRHVPNARLHAVAASDGARAREFAQQYGATYSFGSYEAMLNCPHLDVVYNATTNEKHCPTTLLFLRRRIPVLCEKPLAINGLESAKMLACARENKTFLMEAMWSQFVPAFQKIQEIVTSGAIGRPLSIKADFGGFFPFEENARHFDLRQGGGALLDIGIYCLNFALKLLGKPTEIHAMGMLNPTTSVDDSCFMHLRYADGAVALLNTSLVCKMPVEAWIFGEKGYIEIPPKFNFPHEFTVATYTGGGEPNKETHRLPYEGFGYRFEAEHVQECLAQNLLESPVVTHAYSTDLMALMDTVRAKIGVRYAVDV